MRYPIVLFDLDGTLTNPGLGITNSVMYSLKKYGIEGQPRESLYRFIGPPLHESYEKFYSFSREQAIQAVSYYREYYEEKGMFENEVYPGIKELLRVLTKQGILCLVATSKPEIYAKKILDYYKLRTYFHYIAGANMDGTRTDKAEVIAYAQNRFRQNIIIRKFLWSATAPMTSSGQRKTESIAPVYYLVTAVEKNWKRPELTLLLTQ